MLKELHALSYKDKGVAEKQCHNQFICLSQKMKLDHLIKLSNGLFEELHKQFEYIHALLRDPIDAVAGPISEIQSTNNEFIRLLRCCLKMLQFLESDTNFLWEKCRILFKVLDRVCPPSLMLDSHDCSIRTTKNSFSLCCNHIFGEINEESDQLFNFFSSILEVFIVEFLENEALRKHLFLFYVSSPEFEKICLCRNTHADNCTVLKLVSSHFLLLVKNGLDFSRFLNLLSDSSYFDKMTPAISVDASLKFISSDFILSLPHILQAHLILLASRCVNTHLPIDDRKPNNLQMSCHTNPFELSIKLYLAYLYALQFCEAIMGTNVRLNLDANEFFSISNVHKMNWDKLTQQLSDLVDLSHLQSESALFGTNSKVLEYSASYIHGDHPLIDQLCKEATWLVVVYMVENIFPSKFRVQGLNGNKERLPQEVYCLAAAMNLMNSSLLHIIKHSTQTGFYDEMQMSRDCPPYIRYECLSQLANILSATGCGAEQQVQKFLCDMFEDYGGMHLEIKIILAHISSLLIFSFSRKLDFLWKCCISMMMTLMNLLLFEERNLGLSKIFKSTQSHPRMDDQGLTYRSSSVIIAANMEKARMHFLKKIHVQENSAEGIEEINAHKRQENVCHGERFAECFPSFHRNPSEWEDLIDFMECSPEKDYSLYLKNLKKFNEWKQKRIALLKHQKMTRSSFGKVWKNILRTRTGTCKRAKVKSRDQQSRIHGMECTKDQGSALKDFVEPIENIMHGMLEVKAQEQPLRTSDLECIEDWGAHETQGHASSSGHANRTGLVDLVEPIDCRPGKKMQGKAGLLKRESKGRAVAIASNYNLRPRFKNTVCNFNHLKEA